jgi:hypothetical protein
VASAAAKKSSLKQYVLEKLRTWVNSLLEAEWNEFLGRGRQQALHPEHDIIAMAIGRGRSNLSGLGEIELRVPRDRKLTAFLGKNGQFLMPLVDLLEQCRIACDELIEVTGRAALQAILQLSSQQIAGGPPHPGRRRAGEVVWHGRQPGSVMLSDRKLAVERPRLRQRGRGEDKEVEIPAYTALQNEPRLRARMLEILMRGVSTRNTGR